MVIGVLAVQGAFAEHEKILEKLGVEYIELRQKLDLEKKFDGLILPGGESTVQGKLLKEQDMLSILKRKVENGLPVLATCAGLVLLAQKLSNDENVYLGTLPVIVKRNAYGRQLGSFYTEDRFGSFENIPMKFIRAPYISKKAKGVDVLSVISGKIVGVKYKSQIGIAFHPELTEDYRIHKMFLDMIKTQAIS